MSEWGSDDDLLSSSAVEMREYEREVARNQPRVPRPLRGMDLTEEQIDDAVDDARSEPRD